MVLDIVVQYGAGFLLMMLAFWIGSRFSAGIGFVKGWDQISTRLFIGLIILISIYAIIKTRLDSILLPLLLVLVLAFLMFRKSKQQVGFLEDAIPEAYGIRTVFTSIALPYTLFFMVQVFLSLKTIYFSGDHFIFRDFFFYTGFIDNLEKFGAENTVRLTSLQPEAISGRDPYHYVDLWLSALISFLTRQTAVKSFILLTPVIIYTIAGQFLTDILRDVSRFRWLLQLTPLLLFINPFVNIPIVSGGEFQTVVQISAPKVAILSCCMLAEILFFLKTAKLNGLFLTVMAFVNPLAWPFIAGTFLFYAISELIRYRKININLTYILPFIGILFFVVYYYYHSKIDTVKLSERIFSTSKYDYRLAFRIFVGAGLQTIATYLPFFLIPLLMIGKNYLRFWKSDQALRTISLAIGSASLLALLAYAVLNFIGEAFQFFQILVLPALNILLIITLYKAAVYRQETRTWVPIVLLFSLCVISGFFFVKRNLLIAQEETSQAFIQKLKSRLPVMAKGTAGFYLSSDDYISSASWHSDLSIPAQYFQIVQPSVQLVNLNIITEQIAAGDRDSLMKAGRLHQSFMYNYSLQHTADSMAAGNDPGIRFIREFKPSFLVFTKTAVRPGYLKEFTKDSLVNELNGDAIYFLRD